MRRARGDVSRSAATACLGGWRISQIVSHVERDVHCERQKHKNDTPKKLRSGTAMLVPRQDRYR